MAARPGEPGVLPAVHRPVGARLVEKGVADGDAIIYPTAMAKALVLGRRLSPSLLWKVIWKSEQG